MGGLAILAPGGLGVWRVWRSQLGLLRGRTEAAGGTRLQTATDGCLCRDLREEFGGAAPCATRKPVLVGHCDPHPHLLPCCNDWDHQVLLVGHTAGRC